MTNDNRNSDDRSGQASEDLHDKGRHDTPEGLERQRKGPYDKDLGRRAPPSPGQPAKGE